MKRIDAQLLAMSLKENTIGLKDAKHLAGLGLFSLDLDFSKIPGWAEYYDMRTADYVAGSTWGISYEDFPVHEFALAVTDGPKTRLYMRVHFLSQTKAKVALYGADLSEREWIEMDLEEIPGTRRYEVKKMRCRGRSEQQMAYFLATVASNIDQFPEIRIAIGSISFIQTWMEFNHLHDRFLVAIEREGKPESIFVNPKGKKMEKLTFGPVYEYMDHLPIPCATESDLESHSRKGYHITLSDERFKNHPKFQVPYGVYRRPTWVGETTTLYDGYTYTVIDRNLALGE